MIRGSRASAVALARELGVSDSLIGTVRRGELWTDRAEPRNRNDVPRRVVVETLILAGPRISEFCGLLGGTSTSPAVDCASRVRRRRPMRVSASCRFYQRCASSSSSTA